MVNSTLAIIYLLCCHNGYLTNIRQDVGQYAIMEY